MIPAHYPLRESPGASYIERTRRNVRDSDGTLVLTWGPPRGGTAATVGLAARLGRPVLVINMEAAEDSDAAARAAAWIGACGIGVLNVAGPRASGRGEAQDRARAVVGAVLSALFARG